MQILSSSKGFIQIPAILFFLGLMAIGGYTAVKVPEIIQEQEYQRISEESSIPVGSASSEEILVGFKSGVSNSQRDLAHQNNRAVLKARLGKINTDSIKVPTDSTAQETIKRYHNMPGVEYAEPNFLATAFISPNDTLYSKQWNLHKILSEDAYELSQGGFGPIAIIDTGVDASHPDLSSLIIEGFNTINDTTNTNDDHGHGTHVAGIASAQTNNSNGIASISYQSTILPIKVLSADGTGTYDDVAEGIVYAADRNARIINMSLGGGSDSQTLKRAVDYALGRGSIIVAAAGNNGNTAEVYPAAYSGVLAVSASDQNDKLPSFSSYGGNIFVASPGVSITSALPGGKYGELSGTSMSAPHLSGLIAIALSKDSSLNNTEVIDHIKNTAEKVGPYAYDENGWNPYFGFGRISSGKTLQAVAQTQLEEESLEETAETSSPTPSASPETTSSSRLPIQVPREYSFSFVLQGGVESLNLENSLFTAKVEGGTPNIMTLLSGNLVDVYIDGSTVIKYRNTTLSLSELPKDSKIHVKGNIVQNKLVALEILVQSVPGATSAPPTSPGDEQPTQNQNSGQETVPTQQNKQQPERAPQSATENSVPAQNALPEQDRGRGQVRGVTIEKSLWEQLTSQIMRRLGL